MAQKLQSRRQFLKTSLTGSMALAAGGITGSATGAALRRFSHTIWRSHSFWRLAHTIRGCHSLRRSSTGAALWWLALTSVAFRKSTNAANYQYH